MTSEHPSQRPEAEVLSLLPIITPLSAAGLMAAALARIEPDNTVVYRKGAPDEHRTTMAKSSFSSPDDTAWADQALRIADTLFRDLTTRTFDPETALQNLAWYLTAFCDDPSLLNAALSLIHTGETGHPQPPQNALGGDWKTRVIALRSR